MEIYLFVLIILFILAASDLIVGVGNDAVNFLNSAIGSRVAPRHVILLVASAGIIAGTLFSSGMMEVARKGIFNPQHFYFPELMTIFLAVMLSDIILLDFFNTFGLPTSTTVSIVFELLGAAVAISFIKIFSASGNLGMLVEYINTSKAITIIIGILLSIIVAFTVGAIAQFIARLVFTFDYKKKLSRYGGLFGGISMTIVTFFIVIKGAKSAAFMSDDVKSWIMNNVNTIVLLSIIGWSILFQLLHILKINILKVIVLIGTFALALAFAANDLVNFIGVPLAGLNSYQLTEGIPNRENVLMTALKGKIHTDPWLLILAGLIMIATLYFNKKARGVVKTSVDLSRQYEGEERFASSPMARNLVRANLAIAAKFNKIVPAPLMRVLNSRFQGAGKTVSDEDGNPISFDLIRASVNLIVASILISIATSWKLPLSTTYVTFMVAMGTSLSDKAWGRDSAVYRINGVMTVIAGWFFTAFIAFSIAGIFAVIIYYGETIAIIALSLLALYLISKTHKFHKLRSSEEISAEDLMEMEPVTTIVTTIEKLNLRYKKFFVLVDKTLGTTFESFVNFNRSSLRENIEAMKKVKKRGNKIVTDIIFVIKNLPENELKKGRRYGRMMGATQEIAYLIRDLTEKLYEHIDNNHRPFKKERNENVLSVANALNKQIQSAIKYFEDPSSFEDISNATEQVNVLLQTLDEKQVEMLRAEGENFSARSNSLYLDILSFADNFSGQLFHLISVINKNYMSLQKSTQNIGERE